MLNEEFVDNGVKETGIFGNKFVMECYLRSIEIGEDTGKECMTYGQQ